MGRSQFGLDSAGDLSLVLSTRGLFLRASHAASQFDIVGGDLGVSFCCCPRAGTTNPLTIAAVHRTRRTLGSPIYQTELG
jgi:hypothetical protein